MEMSELFQTLTENKNLWTLQTFRFAGNNFDKKSVQAFETFIKALSENNSLNLMSIGIHSIGTICLDSILQNLQRGN